MQRLRLDFKWIFDRLKLNILKQKSTAKEQGAFDSLAGGINAVADAAGVDAVDGEEVGRGRKTPPHEAGFSFVPIGAGTAAAGKGVYYLVNP